MTPDRTIEVIDALGAARKTIESRSDWLRGAYHNGNRHCAIGAVEVGGGGFGLLRGLDEGTLWTGHFAVQADAIKELRKTVGKRYGHVVELFNDMPWRRHKTVLALFDKTIERLVRQVEDHIPGEEHLIRVHPETTEAPRELPIRVEPTPDQLPHREPAPVEDPEEAPEKVPA